MTWRWANSRSASPWPREFTTSWAIAEGGEWRASMQKLSLSLPVLSTPDLAPRRGLALAALLLGIVLAVPVLVVVVHLAVPGTAGTWSHLVRTVLPEYVATTLRLCLGVGVGVAVVGVATTWLRAAFAFRYGDYWFPEVRSLGGASALFTLAFSPYVYLLARSAFLERAASLQEAGRSLGLASWATFLRIALPLARPALAAGVALALMETLADFGAVSYFAVQTFTVGIYRTWYSLGDGAAAAQLAAVLLGF